jgi:uncharacterized repeat protein (TIGR03803 family)
MAILTNGHSIVRYAEVVFRMRSHVAWAASIMVLGCLSPAVPCAAEEHVLYSFCSIRNCTDGVTPQAGVISDGSGKLYGTTSQGGIYGAGVVFELSRGVNGKWTEKVLHNFCTGINCADGNYPIASLIEDKAGNLYGTTYYGGDGGCYTGCGTVFRLERGKNGKWIEKVLHSFNNNGKDGFRPQGSLALDSSGTLYGTTFSGGAHPNCDGSGCGAVFELKPEANGKWVQKLIHSFDNNGIDGFSPEGGLLIDALGNLYGTTPSGGRHSYGTVFELTRGMNDSWTETMVHSFNGENSGGFPQSSVVMDSTGNLYGATADGGDLKCNPNIGCGIVFEFMPDANGKWREKVLRYFHTPYSFPNGLLLDAVGNLYATTLQGGRYEGGVAYELTPGANGKWTSNPLHDFGASGDGDGPIGNLIFDAAGNLYGATGFGGAYDSGTVFEITP